MLPRLQAGEHLAQIRVGGLAFGGYEPNEARRMRDELKRKALGQEGRRPRAKRAKPAGLAEMGIGMTIVEAPEPPAKAGVSEPSEEGVKHG